MGSPPPDLALKSEATFCVQGVDTWLCGNHLTFSLVTGTGSYKNLKVVRTPEPWTAAILATGLLGLLGVRRRRG